MNVLRSALVPALLSATVFAQDPAAGEEFPRSWFFHDDAQWQEHLPLLGQPMPALDLSEWHNGELDVATDLRGKVVVVDFWATWCGPCIAAIPHNNELVDRYSDQGMVLIGVCGSSSGQESMVSTADSNGVRYPVARDASLLSAEAWKVMWWPTYGVVDKAGNLRALGLRPNHVDAVVEKLLEEPGPATDAVELPPVPEEWKEPRTQGRGSVDALVGRKAPELGIDRLLGGALPDDGLTGFEGRIVLVHFFATWSDASAQAVARNKALLERHGSDRLVVIGVCTNRGADGLERFVSELGVDYLVGVDSDGATASAFKANSYPDDYLIDRQGRLRFADLKSQHVEDALAVLLSEG